MVSLIVGRRASSGERNQERRLARLPGSGDDIGRTRRIGRNCLRDASDQSPTPAQRRLVLAVVTVIFATFGVTVLIGLTAPFAHIPLRIDGFVPAITAVFFVNDLITATLLFGQFSIIRSRALLVLADGYLFTALMAIPFALTFPGAFSPTGLLGAGVQSSAWIYNFWHYGFPLAAIAYAMLNGAQIARTTDPWFSAVRNWLERRDRHQSGVRACMARHGGRGFCRPLCWTGFTPILWRGL